MKIDPQELNWCDSMISFVGILMMFDIPQERGMSHADVRWGRQDVCRFPLFNSLKVAPLQWMYIIYLVMFLGILSLSMNFTYICLHLKVLQLKTCHKITRLFWFITCNYTNYQIWKSICTLNMVTVNTFIMNSCIQYIHCIMNYDYKESKLFVPSTSKNVLL